jgi:hypothetical protein
MSKDWLAWHRPYDEAGSPLQLRLAAVQAHIRRALGACPPGPIRVISMCAGQGRDLLEVLVDHPRRADVTAHLVELDERNVGRARTTVDGAGLTGVEVVRADAASTSAYERLVQADLLLVCGVFGNITDADIRTTVGALSSLCAPRATVIWTRYPRDPDLLPAVDGWFRDAGFELVSLKRGPDGRQFGVGVHRLTALPQPYRRGVRLFTFLEHPDPTGTRHGG